MTILGIKGLTGGLTNQKLAMLGLAEKARECSASMRFPHQMADFVPREGGGEPARFLFRELFDHEAFRRLMATEPVSLEMPTELLPFASLLPFGVDKCMRAKQGDFAANFMLSLKASPELLDIALQALDFFKDKHIASLQLRIERDWVVYLKALEDAGRITKESNTADPKKIFQRIRATSSLDSFSKMYICCDEGDLVQDKSQIKELARSFDLDITFQSDLMTALKFPDPLMMRSMVDFTICESTAAYIGTTRSTFSRALYKSAEWRSSCAPQYAFNMQDGELKLVYDGISS